MKRPPKYRRITALLALERLEELAGNAEAAQSKVTIPYSLWRELKEDYRQHVQADLARVRRRRR